MPLTFTLLRSDVRGAIRRVSLADDGDRVAVAGEYPGLAVLQPRGDGLRAIEERMKPDASCCAFSPDGRLLAFGGKTVKILDTTRGFKTVGAIKLSRREPASALAWSPDGRTLAAAAETARQHTTLALWDAETGAEKRVESPEIGGHHYDMPNIISHMRFLPDGRLAIAAWGSNSGVLVYDAASGAQQRPPLDLLHDARRVEVGPDGSIWADATMIGGAKNPITERFITQLIRWSPDTGAAETVPTPDGYGIWGFALHPGGRDVALDAVKQDTSPGARGRREGERVGLLLSVEDGTAKRLETLGRYPQRSLAALEFSASGERLLVAARSGAVLIYERSEPDPRRP